MLRFAFAFCVFLVNDVVVLLSAFVGMSLADDHDGRDRFDDTLMKKWRQKGAGISTVTITRASPNRTLIMSHNGRRPSSAHVASSSAYGPQRVWHGAPHGTRSNLPGVVTKAQAGVPADVRRKRAVDAFFEQQRRVGDAKKKGELKPASSGGNGGGTRADHWDENPEQRLRLKNGVYSAEDGGSCYYIRQSKEVHGVQLPSYKTDCPRSCAHAGLTTSPNEAGGPAPGDTTSFFVEPLTRLTRERWSAQEAMRAQHVLRHEARYPLRRLKDRSAQTLDNQYRQEMDPHKPGQTVMASVLGGTFYDAPPPATLHGRAPPRMLTPNFISGNKHNVHAASVIVSICKAQRVL